MKKITLLIIAVFIFLIPLKTEALSSTTTVYFSVRDNVNFSYWSGSTNSFHGFTAGLWPSIEGFHLEATAPVTPPAQNDVMCFKWTFSTKTQMNMRTSALTMSEYVSYFTNGSAGGNTNNNLISVTAQTNFWETKYTVINSMALNNPFYPGIYIFTNGPYSDYNKNPYGFVQYPDDRPFTVSDSQYSIIPCAIASNEIAKEQVEVSRGILGRLSDVWNAITNLPSLIWNSIKGGFEAITGAIKGLFDFFKDASSPNININTGLLPPGPLDSIILLPVTMLESVKTQLGGTCQAVILPLPYVNKTLQLPCVKTIFSQITGVNALLGIVSTIAIFYILKAYLMRLYVVTDEILSLEDKEKAVFKEWGSI